MCFFKTHRKKVFSLLIPLLILALVAFRFHRPRQLSPGGQLSNDSFNGHPYTVVHVDLRQASLQLHWKDSTGTPYNTFDRLSNHLAPNRLIFAANSGIFAPGYVPMGLHVENGHELVPLNLADGTGNFFLKPNGVFFIDAAGAHVVESSLYPGTTSRTRLATQSGPLLLFNGQTNPNFRPDSTNTQIRSAVGVVAPDNVVFVLSNDPVTFHQLAMFFRDKLFCRDALYLDGAISRFYPGEKPAGSVESNFAGILAIPENGARLKGRSS
jgi:uncharacterized protein YigE (DUF2233 family)